MAKGFEVGTAEHGGTWQVGGEKLVGGGEFRVGHWGKSLRRGTYYRHTIEFIYKSRVFFAFLIFFLPKLQLKIKISRGTKPSHAHQQLPGHLKRRWGAKLLGLCQPFYGLVDKI